MPRLLFKFAIQGAAGHELTDPRILRLPTRQVGVGAGVSGLGRADIGPRGRHGRLGGMDRRRGQLDFGLGLDQRRLLLTNFVFQLREEQFREELIGLHPVADVHVQLLDVGGQLDVQRRLLEGLDLARLHALPAERLPHGLRGRDAQRGSSRRLRIGGSGRMAAGDGNQRGGSQRQAGDMQFAVATDANPKLRPGS